MIHSSIVCGSQVPSLTLQRGWARNVQLCLTGLSPPVIAQLSFRVVAAFLNQDLWITEHTTFSECLTGCLVSM